MTIKDIYEGFNDDQKATVHAIVALAVKDSTKKKNLQIGALKRKIKRLETENSNKPEAKTNQDKFAEIIKKMDPKVLTEFWTSHTYVEDCDECPAHEYCNKCMLYSEDGWDRVPDENGEILECQDIFERWLKEKTSE